MSRLVVDQLQGRLSGSNTITIPTGHKITAVDSGAMVAPGQVVQVASGQFTGTGSTTSTSATQLWSGVSITPKYSNSLIKVETVFWAIHRDYNDGVLRIYKNGSATSHQTIVRYVGHRPHDTGTGNGTDQQLYHVQPYTFNFTETSGSTSTLTYSVYGWTTSASQNLWYNQAPQQASTPSVSTMILTEIAQ